MQIIGCCKSGHEYNPTDGLCKIDVPGGKEHLQGVHNTSWRIQPQKGWRKMPCLLVHPSAGMSSHIDLWREKKMCGARHGIFQIISNYHVACVCSVMANSTVHTVW